MTYQDYLKHVNLKVSQMFTPLKSHQYGATRVTEKPQRKINYIVLHSTGTQATANQEAMNIKNNRGVESFHVVVDEFGVIETVRFKDVAHHAGDKNANLMSLGFELCEKNIEQGYNNFIKYVGWVMYQLGLQPTHETIRWHNEFVVTSCGKFLREKGKNKVIADIKKYMQLAKTPKQATKPKTQLKVNDKIAYSTIFSDMYGGGKARPYFTSKTKYSKNKVGVAYIKKIMNGGSAKYQLSRTPNGSVIGYTKKVHIYGKL